MLEVLSGGSTELSRSPPERDILINCWNKSSPLIKELERTVSIAERKCGDLMQELHYYKEYYEKWTQFERVNHTCPKKKVKKCCRQASDFCSSSENEFEKANQYLYNKIKSKINEMNNEITLANRRIHSKTENFSSLPKGDLPPDSEPREDPREANDGAALTIENKTCKSEPTMTSFEIADADSGGIRVTEKQSSKSVPARNKSSKNIKRDSGPSKKRYANLQRYKIRSKSLPQGVRRKFGFGGFFEVFEADAIFKNNGKSRSKSRTSLKADGSKTGKSRKSKTRLVEARKPTPKSSRCRIAKSKSDIRQYSKIAKCEPEPTKSGNSQKMSAFSQSQVVNTCTALVPSGCLANVANSELSLNGNLRNLIARPNSLLPFLRHPIPFIPCSSTSKSFNLGLNVQQVLSLIKRKRHSVTLQAIVKSSMQAARSMTEPTVNTLFISQTTTSHSHVTSAICPAREGSEDGFSIVTENRSKCSILKQVQTMRSQVARENLVPAEVTEVEINKLERPEDVWVVEQPDATSGDVRNSRSRCTCFPSRHCVDYNKVLRQYTGWRLPPDPRTPDSPSNRCAKSKPHRTPSGDDVDFGGGENDGRTELAKVHNDLLNLTRKYSSLQKQISENCLDDYEVNAELDAMESELAIREIEFKDILNFYNQLIMLKEKLKSLRTRNGQSQPAPREPECQRPKKNPLRPTPSMALAKVLKKIQGLQDTIKLIDAP